MRNQLAIAAQLNDIDAVDPDSLDFGLKFQNRAMVVVLLSSEPKGRALQHIHSGFEISQRNVATSLRCVYNGTLEHNIWMEHPS